MILLKSWRSFSKRNIKNKKRMELNNKKILSSSDFKNFLNEIPENLTIKIQEFKNHHFDEKTNCALEKLVNYLLEILTSSEIKNLIGGSADLTGSNNTKTKNMLPISKG